MRLCAATVLYACIPAPSPTSSPASPSRHILSPHPLPGPHLKTSAFPRAKLSGAFSSMIWPEACTRGGRGVEGRD